MPSIAGMLFVAWMDQATDGLLSCLISDTLVGNIKTGHLNSAKLLFLFLLGNVFCYVASFPILIFHVTRMIDFRGAEARPRCLFGLPYASALIFLVAVTVAVVVGRYCPQIWKLLPYFLAVLFSGYQVRRLHRAMTTMEPLDGKDASLGYRFQHKLASRKAERFLQCDQAKGQIVESLTDGEIRESYWAMREHGNSAFILFLEFAYCELLYMAVVGFGSYRWSAIAVLTTIWIFPAVLVHGYGQHLERRFSLFGN